MLVVLLLTVRLPQDVVFRDCTSRRSKSAVQWISKYGTCSIMIQAEVAIVFASFFLFFFRLLPSRQQLMQRFVSLHHAAVLAKLVCPRLLCSRTRQLDDQYSSSKSHVFGYTQRNILWTEQ